MEKVVNNAKYNLYRLAAIILVAAALLLGLVRGFESEKAQAVVFIANLESAHSAMLRSGANAVEMAENDAPGETALINAVKTSREKLAGAAKLGDKAYYCTVLAYDTAALCEKLGQIYSSSSSNLNEYSLVRGIKYDIESSGNLVRNWGSEYNLQVLKYNKFALNPAYSFLAVLTGNGPLEGYPQVAYQTHNNGVKNYSERFWPSFDIGGAVLVVLIAVGFVAAIVFIDTKVKAKEKAVAGSKPLGKAVVGKNPVIPGKTPPHRRERSK